MYDNLIDIRRRVLFKHIRLRPFIWDAIAMTHFVVPTGTTSIESESWQEW